MASSTLVLMLLLLSLTPFSFSVYITYDLTFHQCLSNNNAISPETFYTQNDTMFSYYLQFRVMNRRFQTDNTPKPAIIFLPLDERHIQYAVICARKHDIHLRLRSGGHDYEGSSYTSHEPRSFVLLDLRYMRHVNVNPMDSTVWVEAGAILGDLYYRVQKSNKTLGFPSSMHPSVGVGGYITGGGDGTMMRKYGLAADNVLDAKIVNADGEILDRASMGEDVFWAIRGGGGGSYGVIVSWKLKLVPVPPLNTIFYISRALEQGATEILYKWQQVAPTLDDNLFLGVMIEVHPDAQSQLNKTILTSYYGHFLGDPNKLMKIINDKIPELGLKNEDCREMIWHEAVLDLAEFNYKVPTSGCPNTDAPWIDNFKSKSDFVKKVISVNGLERLWKTMLENEYTPYMRWNPHGGMVNRLPESSTPYPHRDVLFDIQYVSVFPCYESDKRSVNHRLYALHRLYRDMTEHVSNSPRQAYVNFRDFELGINGGRYTSYEDASSWGTKYFKDNFKRLAQIKTQFDPSNFFYHEQSIPVIRPKWN